MSPPVIRSADSVTAVRVIRCGWELGARPAPRIYVMSLTKYGASERRRLVERLRDVSHTKKGNHLSMEGEAFLARPRFHSVPPPSFYPYLHVVSRTHTRTDWKHIHWKDTRTSLCTETWTNEGPQLENARSIRALRPAPISKRRNSGCASSPIKGYDSIPEL